MQSAPHLMPIDASSPARFDGKNAKVKFELTTYEVEKGAIKKETTAFHPGTWMALEIKNTGEVPLYFEVALTGVRGTMYLFPIPKTLVLEPGKEIYVPSLTDPLDMSLKQDELSKQHFIVYAAPEAFTPGVVLNDPSAKMRELARQPGYSVCGRVVHPFYKIEGKKIVTTYDPSKMVRKSIEVETLAK